MTVEPEDAKVIFYNDIPASEGDVWCAKLIHQSLGVYSSTRKYVAWRDIPSTYVIGDKDCSTFTANVVEMMWKKAKELQPSAFDVVETCKSGGHCLMISSPD